MRGETAGAVEFSGRRGDKNCGVKVVEVNPKPRKGIVSKLIDLLETVIVKFVYDRSAKPFPFFLTGNFAPVAYETPPQKDLPVKGRLPECLNGEFVRIGPNSKFAPLAGYHWFDGDGMVHGMLIKDGKATYISRYVRTSRLKQEEFFGAAKFFKVGDLKGLFGLLMVYLQRLRAKLKVLDMLYGTGKANTALVYHSGKLLALHEGDKPYVLKVMEDGDLQTLGLQDYDKRLTHSFTAHPKVDPVTGEMFAFGYSQAPPYVSYRVISNDGFMDDPVHVTIPASIMMHDFAITENYAIFMDLPMYFKPKDMVKENKLAYTFDKTVDAHFGILPRYAKNDLLMKWFELPSCFIFHNANAWEEGDEIVLVTCRYETIEMDTDGTTTSGMIQTSSSELYEMRFNMKTGLASQRQLSVASIEFPRINEKYTGRKSRYAYGAVINDLAKITAIVKFDLRGEPNTNQRNFEVGGNVRGIFSLGPQVFGSEAVFVPRGADDSSTTEAEDDGYLLFFAHDENIGKSLVYVIDASTMSADPVAVVELPHRVPYGFHALFVSQEQLDDQG